MFAADSFASNSCRFKISLTVAGGEKSSLEEFPLCLLDCRIIVVVICFYVCVCGRLVCVIPEVLHCRRVGVERMGEPSARGSCRRDVRPCCRSSDLPGFVCRTRGGTKRERENLSKWESSRGSLVLQCS